MSQDADEPRPLARQRSSTTGDLGTSVLRSKIKTLNSLAMNSLGNLFSGSVHGRSSTYMRQPDANIASHDFGTLTHLENDLGMTQNADEDRSIESVTQSSRQYCNLRAEDYSAVKALDYLSVSPGSKIPQALTNCDEEYSFVQDIPKSAYAPTAFPEVRRVFSNLSRSSKAKLGMIQSGTSVPQSLSSLSSRSGNLETPPLTPDSLIFGLPSPVLSLDHFDSSLGLDEFCVPKTHEDYPKLEAQSEEGLLPNLHEIKEGKKPAKPELTEEEVIATGSTDTPITPNELAEWYGLEYTLRMSSRERRPSAECAQPLTVGEHSRSRESWAAIHRGTIHPLFEDEGYLQWKNWHHFLDRQDQKRRHQKGALFKTQARELSWLYVDEMRTREMMYWQKEVYGVVARDVKEKLQYLSEKRPDPFCPARKHNLAWFLKRSRSIGALRELREEEINF